MSYRAGANAMREHMLDGHIISSLEAILLFGVQNHYAEIARMRKDGLNVKSHRVPMTRILARTNKYTACKAHHNLPHKEINMLEYWVES